MDMVTICQLRKNFDTGGHLVKALDTIDLTIEKGKFTAIVGPSGSGKTTLLNIISGLCEPTQGEIMVDGIHLSALSDEQLTVFRRRKIGFVFQECSLIPELTVRENILLPLALDAARPDEAFFSEIVGLLGLNRKLNAYPFMLSGGTQQCAAIARALITKPAIILADEPTGSLDVKTAQNVAGLLKMTAMNFRQTVIMITHNLELAQLADRVVWLQDGRIVSP